MTEVHTTVGSLVGEMVKRPFGKEALTAATRVGIVFGLFLVAARVVNTMVLGEPDALTAVELGKVFACGVGLAIALHVLQTKASPWSTGRTLMTWLIVPVVLFVGLRQQDQASAQSIANAAVLAAGSLGCMLYLSRAARRHGG